MSNTEINRQIVREGLNRKSAARRDAALEKQARKLRIIINDNHIAKTSGTTPARRPEPPKVEPKKETKEDNLRNEAMAERAAEAAYCTGWYSCLLRTFTPMVIAAATMGLSARGFLPIQLTIPITIATCMFALANFAEQFLYVERG